MSQDVFQSSDGGNVKYADNESMWGSSANLGTPVAASTAARPKQTYLDRPSNGAFGSFLDQTSNSDLLENQRLSGLLQDIDLSGVSFSSSESRPSNIASTNSKDNYLTDTSSLGLIPECEMEGLSIGLLPVDSDDNFSDRTITPVAWHNHCPRDSDGEGFIPDSLEEKMIPQDNLGVRGAATGIESDGSEINTDDELEAARKEIARQQRDQYLLQHRRGEIEEQRPGLEGGNSNEDASLISSENEPVSLRQSAEGDVSFSPVPGDGGGGGDGSSGAGTDDSDDDDNESGFNPVSNDAPSTMDVLRRLGLAGDGVDNLIPPMPDYKNSADFPGSSRMRPTGDDDPLNRQVRFVSPSGSTIPSHIRPFQGSTYSQASGRDSDSQYSDELQLASKFFLPTTHSYSNTMAEDVASTPWSFDDSSFHASEIGAITQDNNDDDVEDDHDVTLRCVPDIEFDKTLTSDEIRRGEGDEHVQSPQNPFVGRSSLGSFGLGTGDFTFSQNLAFGEDEFAQLDPAALSPRSNLSNEQMNLSQERAEERAEVQGAESGEEDYVSDPQQSRKSPTGYDSGRESTPHSPSYIEDNGEILTDLAFKSPLPAMNKHGKSLLDAVTSSSSSHHAIILPKDKLVFPATEAGHVFKLKLQIKNEGTVAHTLKFVNPHPPFSISHSEYSIKPRHYLHLPVSFKPEQAGIYESLLVIATDVEHSLVAKLYGECL
ncbi:uncharacterized protein LOC102803549 [Saccoglossus kowalevskii]|uniref:Dentin sialophosphoprotein-like n=1 Tax=Saccoglossus kowalevskii TaxID=10224 RepID=A0ABM0LUE6_SACKO|nr:PREDICTED: dentin sialophosphoprotein-like [Saccoglossus kowalevskii]